MSEISIATESICSFLPTGQQADVPPLEETIFVLTGSQLEQIIARTIQPVQAELSELKDTIASQQGELTALRARVGQQTTYSYALKDDLEALQQWREDQAEVVAMLTRRTRKDIQPSQRDRGEILRALLAANGGKMLAKEARQKMRLSEPLFSMLLAKMKDSIEVKPYHLRRNQKFLILK